MIINETIVELDIHHAGPSIWYELGKISFEEYQELISYDKKTRVVKTGLKIKDDPSLYDTLQEGYGKYTKLLLDSNGIEMSSVYAIVHDAVWLLNIVPDVTQFGEVQFMVKGIYDFLYKYKNYEFFIEQSTQKIKTRNVGHDFLEGPMLKLIHEALINYTYGDKEGNYDMLHEAKRNLKSSPFYYGDKLINNHTPDSNYRLVCNMIKELT